ncbi:hypothetical protein H8D98_00185 [bacterium]|nr:hypothetical protein [bacterium]
MNFGFVNQLKVSESPEIQAIMHTWHCQQSCRLKVQGSETVKLKLKD